MKKKAKLPASIAYDPCESPLLSFMRNHNIPMTREEFLNLNYLGSVPKNISPEEENDFPRQFQLDRDPDDDEDLEE